MWSCLAAAILSTLLGALLYHRVFKEKATLLLLSHGVLSGSLILVGLGNWLSRPWLILTMLVLVVVLLRRPGPSLEFGLERGYLATLTVIGFVIVLYTLYHQWRFLDTDSWIHDPSIASMALGLMPPVHPYTPDQPLHYHYGRDLLIAVLTTPHTDPLGTLWLVNPVLQLAGFLGLFASLRCLSGSSAQALLGAVMAFFGMCVGFRVGMINSFDVYNGVTLCQLVPLFHQMVRLLGPTEPSQWLVSGLLLGTYQLVYESSWGLLLMAGGTLALIFARRKKVWAAFVITALIAIMLAAVEGGIFSNVLARSNQKAANEVEALKGMHVSLSFPKQRFLQLPVTTARYQRLSGALNSPWFRKLAPELEDGYLFVFHPRFLMAFWIQVWLAPLSLWLLRKNRAGLAFWLFGMWSFLVPGLVEFGERYEKEYFIWEFLAGFGFAVAFGMALGQGIDRLGGWRGGARVIPLYALLCLSLVGGVKVFHEAFEDLSRNDLRWSLDAGWWRVVHPDLGLEFADLEAMEWLGSRCSPGDQVLSNLGSEVNTFGLWPDAILSSRTGAHVAGRFRPVRGLKSHGYPIYNRDGQSKAFALTGDIGYLQAIGVRWFYADLKKLPPTALQNLTERSPQHSPPFVDSGGFSRQVFEIPALQPDQTAPKIEAKLEFEPPAPVLRGGKTYPAMLTLRSETKGVVAVKLSARTQEGELDPDCTVVLLTSLEKDSEKTLPFALFTPFSGGPRDYFLDLGEGEVPLELPDFKVESWYWERTDNRPQQPHWCLRHQDFCDHPEDPSPYWCGADQKFCSHEIVRTSDP